MTLESKIEGLLFYKGEEMSVTELAHALGESVENVKSGLDALDSQLALRGVALMRRGDEALLVASAELSDIITRLRKEELDKELSRAALETLSIILYRTNASKSDIDYIRGVNSGFILRNLMIRGLIERISDPNDSRKALYRPTASLLSYMGVASVAGLPDYHEVSSDINNILTRESYDN